MTVDVKVGRDALLQLESELRSLLKTYNEQLASWADSAPWPEDLEGWADRLAQIRLALLSTEDAPPNDPGTLTVTYGARSCTVSPVSRATYDAVCTVLHGRDIQDPRPPGETDTP